MPVMRRQRGMLQHKRSGNSDEDENDGDLGDDDGRVEVSRLLDANYENGGDYQDRDQRDQVEHAIHVRQGRSIDSILLQNRGHGRQQLPAAVVEDNNVSYPVRAGEGVRSGRELRWNADAEILQEADKVSRPT